MPSPTHPHDQNSEPATFPRLLQRGGDLTLPKDDTPVAPRRGSVIRAPTTLGIKSDQSNRTTRTIIGQVHPVQHLPDPTLPASAYEAGLKKFMAGNIY